MSYGCIRVNSGIVLMLKPEPGAPALIDYDGDARRIFDVVAKGGTAIMPVTTG